MPVCVAKIAVSAATYWVDRPYDYLVPAELQEKALPGARAVSYTHLTLPTKA